MVTCNDESTESVSVILDSEKTILRDSGLSTCFSFSVLDSDGNTIDASDIHYMIMNFSGTYCTYSFIGAYNTIIEESDIDVIEISLIQPELSEHPDFLLPESSVDISNGSIRCYEGNTRLYSIEIPDGCEDVVVDATRIGEINDSEELSFTTVEKRFVLYTKGLTVDENVFISEIGVTDSFMFCIDSEIAEELNNGSLYGQLDIVMKDGSISTGNFKIATVK